MTPDTTRYPLCVDLDETLILSDNFYTGLWRLLTRAPWRLPRLLLAWRTGRPQAKALVNAWFPADPAALPYRTDLLDYLRAQRAQGRALYLVSASDEQLVARVAAHVGLFNGAYGSSGSFNAKGRHKAALILREIGADFVYAGDSRADLAIWRLAHGAVLCGKACGFAGQLNIPIEARFPARWRFPVLRQT